MKSAEEITPQGVADTPEGCAVIRRNRLEKWAGRNLMKLSIGRVQNLPPGKKSPVQRQHKSKFAEIIQGILVDSRLCAIQQCAVAAMKVRHLLGCIRESVASKSWSHKMVWGGRDI